MVEQPASNSTTTNDPAIAPGGRVTQGRADTGDRSQGLRFVGFVASDGAASLGPIQDRR